MVEQMDGSWGAFEVKVGMNKVDAGVGQEAPASPLRRRHPSGCLRRNQADDSFSSNRPGRFARWPGLRPSRPYLLSSRPR